MIERFYILMVILFGLTALITSLCLDQYEAGVRVGYEKGLEDGIQLTNEVNEEDNN